MLYEWHDTISSSVKFSFRAAANAFSASGQLMNAFKSAANPPGYTLLADNLLSSAKTMQYLSNDQPDPSFGLWRTRIGSRTVTVNEEVLLDKSFCRLLHFKCETGDQPRNVPKVLIVAPISGHRATILRDTVRELLPDNDVYITDWKDAREVPLKKGKFDLEDYISYLQDFLHEIGPQTHVIGISQSTVPVLAVTSLLAARKDPCQPLSMTLMCGPIDPRINETEISRLARQHDINWYEQNVIVRVSDKYAGHGRRVYPGFLQAMGVALAAPQHSHHSPESFLHNLYGGQGEKLDADAPYHLDTIQQVFLEHRLPRGTMTWRGEKVDPSKIQNTALFTIEGTDDNITAPGQTFVAHKLCSNIQPHLKCYHVQKGAGHYDLFSGGKHWEPEISNKYNYFIRKIAAYSGIAYDPLQADTLVKASPVQRMSPVLAA